MDRLTYTSKGAGMAYAIARAWHYIRQGRKSRKQLEDELEAMAEMLDNAREEVVRATLDITILTDHRDTLEQKLKEARAEIGAMYEVISDQLEEREELEDELRAELKEARAERDSWKAKALDKEKEKER